VDRRLEEAVSCGPDPLHLVSVFGIDDKTAIRYIDAARHLLETEAERHAIRRESDYGTAHGTNAEVT
jgi:hypothetical protein